MRNIEDNSMKQIFSSTLAIILMVLLVACNSAQEEETSMYTFEKEETGMYTFEKIDDESKLIGTSWLISVIDGFPADYSKQCVLFQGKLLNLFGVPLYETVNLENQYSYIIQAKDNDGRIYYLNVYRGSSGPAIGADSSIDGIKDAALTLVEEIQVAIPVDFSYEGYYPDGPSKIFMGIRDGEAYYIEETMTDPDEIAHMMEKVY